MFFTVLLNFFVKSKYLFVFNTFLLQAIKNTKILRNQIRMIFLVLSI